MSKLDDLIGDYESNDVNGDAKFSVDQEQKRQIKDLILELIGDDFPYGSTEHYRIAQNNLKAELRRKVEEL